MFYLKQNVFIYLKVYNTVQYELNSSSTLKKKDSWRVHCINYTKKLLIF